MAVLLLGLLSTGGSLCWLSPMLCPRHLLLGLASDRKLS